MIPLKSDKLPGPSVPAAPGRYPRAREHTRFLRFFRIFRAPARAATGLLLLAAIVLGAQPEPVRAQTDTATYTVTFKGNWNTQSTTVAVPSNAHFTTLIGAVHNDQVTFWAAGQMATAGVEGVAELGATSTFESEITAAGEDVKSKVKASGTSATGQSAYSVAPGKALGGGKRDVA